MKSISKLLKGVLFHMDDKGTIIYIGGFELPDKNAAAHRVLSNGKVFRDLGYNVVFIGIDKSLNQNSNILDTKRIIQGFDTWSIPYPAKAINWINYLSDIKRFKDVFKMYEDTRLVVAYNYQSIALNRLKKYCRNHDCKIIADCTEWYSTKGTALIFKIIKGFDSFLRMRIIQKQLDGLIVISTYLEKYYNQCCPTIKIPPLVDKEESKWEQNSYDDNQNKLKFVFSGTLGRNKDNVDKIIEAFYEFKDNNSYILKIIGINKQDYIDKYPHHIYIVDELQKRVLFTGRKPHVESIRILNSADFCIFIREESFSTKAGFPTKFVESITCGVPVITSNSSDLSDYLEDSVNGFILDIDNKINTITKLKEILDMGRDGIFGIKRNIDTDTFNYKNYESKIKLFLENQLDLSTNIEDR